MASCCTLLNLDKRLHCESDAMFCHYAIYFSGILYNYLWLPVMSVSLRCSGSYYDA